MLFRSQDVERGTFSHRHCAVTCQETGEQHIALNALADGQARFCVHNSPLTENAVLGFEYGYSLGDPKMLVIWEAQFGDFANGAQVLVDQFIASGEAKWKRATGLALFLPHGYEGQGPEHSSARLDRFLQLCADDNMQVVYPTTTGQIFHLIRKQVKQPFRKPLVVMTPKSMLRLPAAQSRVEALVHGHFRQVLPDVDCQRMIDRWAAARAALVARKGGAGDGPMQRALVEFRDALADDLNLARAIAALNTAIGEESAGDAMLELAALDAMDSVLAVFERNEAVGSAGDDDFAASVEALLVRRRLAREAKDWAESDRVRDQLAGMGVRIKDGPQGTTWERVADI